MPAANSWISRALPCPCRLADRHRFDPAHWGPTLSARHPQPVMQHSLLQPVDKGHSVLAPVADIGDVPLVGAFNLEGVVAEIHAFYAKLRQARIVPITAGGDHSITYPILKAIAAER